VRERNSGDCMCPHSVGRPDCIGIWCLGHRCACWLWTLDPDEAKEQGEHATGRCGLAHDSQDLIDDVTTEG
jgi:hypothetical protein